MTKKILIALLIILLALGAAIAASRLSSNGLSPLINRAKDQEKFSSCVEDLGRKKKQYYEPGTVLILFPAAAPNAQKEDYGLLTDDEILAILNEYDLRPNLQASFGRVAWDGMAIVKVEEGKEIEWVCLLSQDNRIVSAELNGDLGSDGTPQ